jgi:hypothetical protein
LALVLAFATKFTAFSHNGQQTVMHQLKAQDASIFYDSQQPFIYQGVAGF